MEQPPQDQWEYVSGALAAVVAALVLAIRRLMKQDSGLSTGDRDMLVRLQADLDHLARLPEKLDRLEDIVDRQAVELANLKGKLGI